MSNNNLTIFNNEQFGELRIVKINGVDGFNLSDVCFGLGYTKTSKGKLYLRKDEIENICETLDIKGLSVSDNLINIDKNTDFVNTYINEDNFYDLCLESKAKNARVFRKWVTSEVLPSIRQNGGYITDNASEEQIDKLTKYSLPKLKNTFKTENIEQIHSIYQDVKEFHKNKVRDTDLRLKMMKNIEQGLKDRIENYKNNKQIAFITICDDLIKIIKEDKEELRLRISGGQKAYKTRIINNQERLIEEQKDALNNLENTVAILNPSLDEYTCLSIHPISENYLYETVVSDYTGKNITVKTNTYKNWIRNFPSHQMINKEDLDIDWEIPIVVFLKFDCLEKFDIQNFIKATIDQIVTKELGEDDKIVDKVIIERNKTVDSYKDGKVYFCIKNIK